MQTAQIELGTSGIFAGLVAKIGGQVRVLTARAALQARINAERKQLLDMPEYLLKDIGITRAEAVAEASSRDLPCSRC